ncbi:putative uncharacterized ph domain-containing protein [Phaeomoniella chlamydospora]|uniref:Uncharacterized ph domain-containing protein n=1 Tax=Phaeomoniella chlamydospora TaxID=158046 RepID=A0A0G2GB68_PHACM|nr:putative uncharacterized ph domain-containing protein [Phaeomoniella chlamydospora]
MTFTGFLFIYVLGGLTFLPLVLGLILLHAYLTFPTRLPGAEVDKDDSERDYTLRHATDDEFTFKTGTDLLEEKFNRKHEGDVAAGYFAVCREYVPGGVNGKPPARTTPAGEVVAAESPSVYQSMYRSIFDRKEKPTIEPNKSGAKAVKKGNNVFFVVLRHGHLMLYDDAEQIEVRHVISLEYHDVCIYGGGEEDIPEGELWIKRNAICLRRKRPSTGDMGITSLPFFLFSENPSEKEDFYFALLINQQRIPDAVDVPPEPLQFRTKDIIELVQKLHSSQEHLQTRWLNALLGRLFLALYKTPEAEAFFRKKIVKKISRVKKPNFITKISLHKIDMGEGGPFILNPRLRDLTINGDSTIEADVMYAGNFRLEIGATLRIDLGSRFKPRDVDIVLAVVCRKLEGHILLRMKPPPSNRLWFTFETMPKIDLVIEPLVSTRQITYSVILRTIESKIKETIAESLVFPFWDDVPFLDTEMKEFRGGLWKEEPQESKHEEIKDEDAEPEPETVNQSNDIQNLKQPEERTMSMPTIPASPPNIKQRGNKSKKSGYTNDTSFASSTGVDKVAGVAPRAIRSNSFASPADPKVTTNNANAASLRRASLNTLKKDAAAAMKEISDRSLSTSPSDSPFGSPPAEKAPRSEKERTDSMSSKESLGLTETDITPRTSSLGSNLYNTSQTSLTSGQSAVSLEGAPPKRTGTLASLSGSLASADRKQSLATLSAATIAAKKWGMGMVNRGNGKGQEEARPGTPEHPIGRGRPLPPPGQPLPPPNRGILGSIPTLPRRKPIPPRLPQRPVESKEKTTSSKPPLPERRKQRSASHVDDERSQEVMVVEAPADSAPTTPVPDDAPEELFGQSEEEFDTSQEPLGPHRPPLPSRGTSGQIAEIQDGETIGTEKAITELASAAHGYDAA